MNINDLITTLIGKEGKYSNDPADNGGETCWGVTVAVARAFGYTGPMATMPRDVAASIYRQRYWIAPRFIDINGLAPSIAEELLDTGVNMGTVTAGKFLQRALNVLAGEKPLYPPLDTDGHIGNMTIDALRLYLQARGAQGVVTMLNMLNAQQSVRYMELAEQDHAQYRFEYGWQSNRVAMT